MSNIERLLAAINKAKTGGATYEKESFYYPERDNAGNGSATVRFMPPKNPKDKEAVPFAMVYSHGFKSSSGKWYIEECPTSIGKECPVCEANSEIVGRYGKWEVVPEEFKQIVRIRKRKLAYIVNVLVIKDSKTPENEGKIFKMKIGQKIFKKIEDKLQPKFEDETAFDPFDLEEGANFKLRICKEDGQTNYDKSEFESPSVCKVPKSELESMEDVSMYLAESRYKKYEELKSKANAVIGNSGRVSRNVDDDEPFEAPVERKSAPRPAPVSTSKDDDDEMERMLRELAED